MVNLNNNEQEVDIELETTNSNGKETDEAELEDIEESSAGKIKKLQAKINRLNDEKKQLQDDFQRTKADFLNARKRLEEEKNRDRVRFQKKHIEDLLPLCDSFEMAMANKEVWEKADTTWRTGIEAIKNQLMRILEDSGVKVINPLGEPFDPYRDEAVGTEEVTEKDRVDKVLSVLQRGYEIKAGDTTEVIRHARVITGILK